MLTLILYAVIESVLLLVVSFFVPGIWWLFIPLLAFVTIISGFSWIRHYKAIAVGFAKPDNFTDEEYTLLVTCPAITFTRVQYGFRTPEVSAMNGLVQLLLVANLVLSLVRVDFLSVIISAILIYFANFTYSSKIPGASPEDDLTRILYATGVSVENAKQRVPDEVEEYVELITKLRGHFERNSQKNHRA